MCVKTTILALLASSLPLSLAAPSVSGPEGGAVAAPLNATTLDSRAPAFYSGPWQAFPAMDTWLDFTSMFNANQASMMAAGSTADDVSRINTAIQDVAASESVDERVILGIIMEESTGYVGVVTTYDADGQPTGGLMQASGCHGYDGQKDLPQEDTTYMVTCGTQHFKQNLADWGNLSQPSSIYPALREYNSGSVDSNNLSEATGGAGNMYYVSDLAQRFQGWTD